MSQRLEALVGACFYYSGLTGLARFWIRRSGQRLIILCYHRASGGHLRRQLLYLKRHYRLLHLEAALQELYAPVIDKERSKDTRTSLVVAFDDGYRDNYTEAFALARELHIPITIFLVADTIENMAPFAWLAGEDHHLIPYASINEVTVEGQLYHLNAEEERQALAHIIDSRVRYATSISGRKEFLASTRSALGVSSSLTENEKGDLPFTWPEAKEMEESEWISFGAHTMHHPTLTCLTDPLEVSDEMRESRLVLEQRLGHPIRTFAYPYGEFGEREKNAAQAAGFTCAVTTVHGFNTAKTDPYTLHRIVVGVHQHWLVLAAKVSGIWEFFLHPGLALVNLSKNVLKNR